jgi:hypothetical protein
MANYRGYSLGCIYCFQFRVGLGSDITLLRFLLDQTAFTIFAFTAGLKDKIGHFFLTMIFEFYKFQLAKSHKDGRVKTEEKGPGGNERLNHRWATPSEQTKQ